jgi:hypothetical protein
MTPLLSLLTRDTTLRRTSAHGGGEYSGPCPLCRRGTDHFKYWQGTDRWACLGPKAGRSGCDKGGDAIQYLRERDRLTYREACDRLGISAPARPSSPPPPPPPPPPPAEALAPPNPTWQAHAGGWAARCAVRLWKPEGEKARAYLHRRGLCDEVLRACNVGYNPADAYEDHSAWGLARPEQGAARIWIPRGITLPWYIDGSVWRLNIRRPLTPAQIGGGEAKYIGPGGFANALYNAQSLQKGKPAVLVEGELDALSIIQALGDEVAAVATGSTAGARRQPWVARLALASIVLVAFDCDKAGSGDEPGAGDKASLWWLHALPNSRRWRPLLHDVNSLPDPEDVRHWLRCGLAAAHQSTRYG